MGCKHKKGSLFIGAQFANIGMEGKGGREGKGNPRLDQVGDESFLDVISTKVALAAALF